MARQTSIDAYTQIKEEGLLGDLQFKVYDAMYSNGPATQGELWQKCFPNHQRHDVAPRFAELERQGLFVEVGERPCQVTGRVCIVWDVSGGLPIKNERPTKFDVEREIRSLREEVGQVKNELQTLKRAIPEAKGQLSLF